MVGYAMTALLSLLRRFFQYTLGFLIMVPSFLVVLAGINFLASEVTGLHLVITLAAVCAFLFGLWLQVRD